MALERFFDIQGFDHDYAAPLFEVLKLYFADIITTRTVAKYKGSNVHKASAKMTPDQTVNTERISVVVVVVVNSQ